MSVDTTYEQREATGVRVGESLPSGVRSKRRKYNYMLGYFTSFGCHTLYCSNGWNDTFTEFLMNNTAQQLNDEKTHYLIYDGAPSHRGVAHLLYDIHVKTLPLNSPFLNPVEKAISCLKTIIKANISRPHIQLRMNNRQAARNALLPLGEFRKQVLIIAAEKIYTAQQYRSVLQGQT